jgi:hypothetical protein
MKRIISLLFLFLWVQIVQAQLQYSVSTNKSQYLVGDTIFISVSVTNQSSSYITLQFPSTCQGNYYLDSYNWYSHIICAQVLTSLTLSPSQSHSWQFAHKISTTGEHKIVGEVLGYGKSDTLIVRTNIASDCSTINLCAGWNLVFLPRVPADFTASTLFPGKFGSMFGYCCPTGYCEVSLLEMGKGYWVYYPSPATVSICGAVPGPITVPVCLGWNLVGSRETTISTSSLVAGGGATIFGSAFRHNCTTGTYESTTVINPFEAVWVYVTSAGTITIP